MKKTLVLMSIFALLIPITYSNGGCIKIADDMLVQLSSSPLVPIVNKQTSFLISFGNNDGLINKDINGNLKIVKNDDLVLEKSFKVNEGILGLKHEFESPGVYEIFLDFKIGNKTYAPEDFLIEVKEEKLNFVYNILFLFVGIVIGMLLMKLIKNKK
ncbi:hypothetical protein HYV80_03930 [Candidatus Woesearchaeota archaeon]|nr:hypothetical protein [Candidatus Woesearchaeota archaeon]